MLKGIDISNHQGDNGIELDKVLKYYDFCIVKATGGNHFVDPYCDGFIQKCKKQNKLWGFYHLANDGIYGNAKSEADYFYNNCKNYFGYGIPILDWEVNTVTVEWVNAFVKRIHELTGIWCWIYGNTWRFNEQVEQNCARWIASYPSWIYHPDPNFNPGDCPKCNGLVAAWQYASDGRCKDYPGDLDVSIFYGDKNAWLKYCGQSNSQNTTNNKKKWHFETEKFSIDIQEK